MEAPQIRDKRGGNRIRSTRRDSLKTVFLTEAKAVSPGSDANERVTRSQT